MISRSPEETFAWGMKLGTLIKGPRAVCFFGDLAAGKTTFIKGFVAGAAGISPDLVSSPTFVLLNIYEGLQTVYHFDLYRLRGPEEFFNLGFEEYWSGLCCLEWSERIASILPEDAICIHMRAIDPFQREISIEGFDVEKNGLCGK